MENCSKGCYWTYQSWEKVCSCSEGHF